MAETLSAAMAEVLNTLYAPVNSSLPADSKDRVKVYEAQIVGTPTNRYAVVYAPPLGLTRGSWGPRAADAYGQPQVTFAASNPTSDATSAMPVLNRLAQRGVEALVDAELSIDGYSGPIRLASILVNKPFETKVVADRTTVEITALFDLTANRI
jgi:hypothetical protein